jgi:glycosyltransferase involved in cell wall biosynthesis
MKDSTKNLSENRRIFYLYTGDHPVHRKFAEAIDADIGPLSWNVPKGYDIYLSEGEFFKPIILKTIGKLGRKSKIINLFSDPRLFYQSSGKRFDPITSKTKKTSIIKRFLFKKLLGLLDGALCGGKFEEKLLNELNTKIPRRIVYPFVSNERLNVLKKLLPSLEGEEILFIGNGPDFYYKGLDILIDSFVELKKKFPSLKLNIVGKWKVKKEWKIKGVIFHGEKKNIVPYLSKSSLYLHLGRGEAFGVTILEAMCAGIPAIVSNLTGAMEIVKKVDEDLIVPLEKKRIVRKVEAYLKLSQREKKKLGNLSRIEGYKVNEKDMLTHFKKQFYSLKDNLYKNGL